MLESLRLHKLRRYALEHLGLQVQRLATQRCVDLCYDLQQMLIPAGEAPTFFDVGANRGQFSKHLLRNWPGARVFAFEPMPTYYDALSRALPSPSAQAINLALSDTCGTARMSKDGDSAKVCENGAVTVPSTTIDAFCQKHIISVIDLLKTDCDGHDEKVIAGARSMLAAGNIRAVYCEVNLARDGYHGDFFAIHEMLAPHQFRFYGLYDYCGRECPSLFANALWLRAD